MTHVFELTLLSRAGTNDCAKALEVISRSERNAIAKNQGKSDRARKHPHGFWARLLRDDILKMFSHLPRSDRNATRLTPNAVRGKASKPRGMGFRVILPSTAGAFQDSLKGSQIYEMHRGSDRSLATRSFKVPVVLQFQILMHERWRL